MKEAMDSSREQGKVAPPTGMGSGGIASTGGAGEKNARADRAADAAATASTAEARAAGGAGAGKSEAQQETLTWEGLRQEAARLANQVGEALRKGRAEIPSAAEAAEWRIIQSAIEELVDKAREIAGSQEAALERTIAERDGLKEALTRARADFLDYQARAMRERERVEEQTLRSYMADLLPVFDSLDLAMKDIAGNPSVESLANAFKLLGEQLRHVVAPRGLAPIAALGSKYDPMIHQAVAFMPATKENPPGTIIEELRKGYTWKGLVLRPSEVIVAKGAESGDTAGGAKKEAEKEKAEKEKAEKGK